MLAKLYQAPIIQWIPNAARAQAARMTEPVRPPSLVQQYMRSLGNGTTNVCPQQPAMLPSRPPQASVGSWLHNHWARSPAGREPTGQSTPTLMQRVSASTVPRAGSPNVAAIRLSARRQTAPPPLPFKPPGLAAWMAAPMANPAATPEEPHASIPTPQAAPAPPPMPPADVASPSSSAPLSRTSSVESDRSALLLQLRDNPMLNRLRRETRELESSGSATASPLRKEGDLPKRPKGMRAGAVPLPGVGDELKAALKLRGRTKATHRGSLTSQDSHSSASSTVSSSPSSPGPLTPPHQFTAARNREATGEDRAMMAELTARLRTLRSGSDA